MHGHLELAVIRRLRHRSVHDDERGLVLVFVLIFGVVMFGMLALTVDLGNVRQERRQAQTSADASSLAAAQIIEKYGPLFTGVPGQWVEVVAQVKGYAQQNWDVKASDWIGCEDPNALSFKPDAGNGNACISADYQVWPTLPPDIPAASATDTQPAAPTDYVNRVRVRLPQRAVTSSFGAVLGAGSLSTAASATAAVTRDVEWTLESRETTTTTPPVSTTTQVLGGPCALCILGTGLTLDGQNGDVTISGGDVVVNSTASTSASLNPNGHVKITSANGRIGGPNAPANFSGSGYLPTPTYHAAVPDPLYLVPQCGNGSYGQAPDGTTPASMSPPPSECNPGVARTSGSKGSTLDPGVYTSIKDSHTLNPGVYVIKGGDITLNGNDVIQGNGVMIYLACSNYPTPCAAGEQGAGIKATGNGYLKLNAPTSGNFKGMTLFSDRNNTSTATYRGNGTNENGPNSGNSGTIYLKSGTLDLRGNGYSLASMIVINKLTMNGNPSAVTISYDLTSNYAVYTPVTTTTPGTEVTVIEYWWHAVATDDNTGLIS